LDKYLKFCERRLKKDPDKFIPYFSIGFVYTQYGNYEKAVEYFHQGYEIFLMTDGKNNLNFA